MNVAVVISFWIFAAVENDLAAVEAMYLKPRLDEQAPVIVRRGDSTEPIATRGPGEHMPELRS